MGGALSGSWMTMPFPPPELWKQQARMQRPVARGPCDMLLSFQKSITWCFLVSSVCPHVLRYKPSETVCHLSFLLSWCPCSASHLVGRVWVLCSLGRKASPASSPGLGHWGPASPLPVWPAGGPEGDGGADAPWGPEGTRELLFFLVRQAERHPKKSTSRSSSGQAVDTDPAAPGHLGLPG